MIGYETTFIVKADSSEDNQKNMLDKFKGIIEAHGGELMFVENWGRRRLSYPIQKETRGTYIYMVYTGNNSLVAEMERNIKINEQIIRYLSVKLGDDFEPSAFKRHVTPATVTAPVAQTEYVN